MRQLKVPHNKAMLPKSMKSADARHQVWTYLQFFTLIVVLLMLGVGTLIYVLNRQVTAQRARIGAENLLLADVNELGYLASDLETSQRGYFLTHKDFYLEPYRRAKPRIAELRPRIAAQLDSDETRMLYARIERSLDNKIVELEQTFTLERTTGLESALELIRSDVGLALMSDLRDDLLALRAAISLSSSTRTNRVTRLTDMRDGTLLSLVLIAGLVSLASLLLLRAQSKAQKDLDIERERADKANLASREKSTFLANMSHEIRTPMNAIFGFAQLLKETVTGDREKFYVQAINQSGQVLLGLINDILDMSKIEAGKLELQPQSSDLREVFRSCETLFSHMAAEKGLRLEVQLPPNLPKRATIDALRLRQVIINLIGNALKYTDRGSVTTRVTTEPQSPGLITLVIVVADTGMGIPQHKQQKIFEPFIQLGNGGSSSSTGAGLGLSIVKRIVELMGGEITISSTVGRGSAFMVRLPNTPVIDDSESWPAEAMPAVSAPLPPLKIVVVDDVELNRRLIEGMFISSPHTVFLADGGISGVALAAREIPDVVLMDIRMPDISGVEALQRIRDNPDLKHVRVIAATASSMLGEEGPLRKQFDGYLRKPITRESLEAELRRFFRADIIVPTEDAGQHAVELGAQSLELWQTELPELMELINRATRTLSSDDVTALVNHMLRLGDVSAFEQLLPMAREISNASAVFDIVTLETLIRRLQALCEELLENHNK